MNFHSKKIAYAALMLGLFVGWARAQTQCPKIFHSLAGTVSERYKKLAAEYDRVMAIGSMEARQSAMETRKYDIYRLLQESFYPILNRITDKVAKATDHEIRRIEEQIRLGYKVHRGKYKLEGYNPRMKLNIPEVSDDEGVLKGRLNSVMKYNIQKSTNRTLVLGNPAYEPSKEFLWAYANPNRARDFGISQDMLGLHITPIGAYGKDHAERLIRTTQILSEMVANDPGLRRLAEKTYANSKSLLEKHAQRTVAAASEKAKPELTPLGSALEGIFSLHQAFANLTGKEIAGAPTATEAMRQIVFEGGAGGQGSIIADYTTRMPMGYNGPISMSGMQYAHPALVRNSAGKLELSGEVKGALRASATAFKKEKSRCPMAGLWKKEDEKPGLQSLAEAYWKIYSSLDPLK